MRPWILSAVLLVASGTSHAMEHRMSPLEVSLVRDNLCAKPDVQARLVAAYNSQPALVANRGELKAVANLRTTHVSIVNHDLTCAGDYTFANGETAPTNFGFPFDFRTP